MPPQSEAELLRDSLTREVSNDAYAIAQQIFKGPEADVARVSNQELDERYRQAFLSNDRQYLMQEATRDPAQFMASLERLGVSMPPGEELEPELKLPAAAKSNAPVPKPPASALQQLYPTPEAIPSPTQPTPAMAVPTPPTPPPPLAPSAAPPIPPPAAPPY